MFSLLGSKQSLLGGQATWIAAKLADSMLNSPFLVICCTTAAMFCVPAYARLFMEFGNLSHLINIKGNNGPFPLTANGMLVLLGWMGGAVSTDHKRW